MSLRTVRRHGACAESVDVEWNMAEVQCGTGTGNFGAHRENRVGTLAASLVGAAEGQAGYAVGVDAHEAGRAGDRHRQLRSCLHMAAGRRGDDVVDTLHSGPLASVGMVGMHSQVL